MNKGKRRIDRMNSFVVGIDLGEKESDACYMSPDGEIKEGFKFPMNKEGYTEFRKKIPVETRMIFTMLKERKEWKYENPGLTESKLSRLEEA